MSGALKVPVKRENKEMVIKGREKRKTEKRKCCKMAMWP